MGNLKAQVLKFERRLDALHGLDVRKLTPKQVRALDVTLLMPGQIEAIGFSKLSDEQLDTLKNYLATDEEIAWLEGLTDGELSELIDSFKLPPVA